MSAAESKSPIKVLHLIDSGGLYGAEKMLLALCKEQKKQGIQPFILSCGVQADIEKPIEAEAKRLGIDVIAWRMKPGLNVPGVLKTLRLAKTHHVNVLHSHGYKFNILLGLIPKAFHSFKLLTTVHGYVQAKIFSIMWLYEVLDRVALRRFDRVVLVTEKMYEIPAIARLNQRRLAVIGNGIPSNYNQIALAGEDLAFRTKFKTCLVAVGRLSPEKGFFALLDALSLAFESHVWIKQAVGLVMYGEGELRADIAHRIALLGLDDNVHLAGYCDDAGAHLANFDALVMPSLTEGLPITLLEAMRAKVPIIASKVGGIPYVLTDEMAYLLNPHDMNALADSVIHIAEQTNKAKSKVSKAYDHFKESYTSHVMSAQYADVYQELLDLNTSTNSETAL
jgi:glycosyltransferase involved in cell wall biosynthesis